MAKAMDGFHRPELGVGYSTLGVMATVTAGYGRFMGMVSYTQRGMFMAGVTARVLPW